MIGISTWGISMCVIVFMVMHGLYKEYHRIELEYLAFGFLLYGLILISYMILAFYVSNKIANLASDIHVVLTIISFAIGFNLTLIGFQGLIEAPIPRRYYIYVVLNGLIFPFIFSSGFSFEWVNNSWRSVYTPPIYVIATISPVFYVGIEIGLSTFKMIKDTPYSRIKFLFIGMTLSFLSTGIIFLIRDTFNLVINIFAIPMTLYFVSLAFLIRTKPELFLTSSIDPQFLLIIEGVSGLPIKAYHFVDNVFRDSNEVLMAGALTAIQSVLNEQSLNEQKINYIGFADTHLTIERRANIEFILASKQNSEALKALLRIIRDSCEIETGQGSLSAECEEKLDMLIYSTFVHQMNRLDLALEPKVIS
ncbi:MAG: hypothetical protein ACW99F_01105 [Candidatus Hodarchaeales archaeon]